MKLNLTVPIFNEDGTRTNYKISELVKKMQPKKKIGKNGKIIELDEMEEVEVTVATDQEATLGMIIRISLLRKPMEDRDLLEEVIYMRYKLFCRIRNMDEVEVSEEEIKEIKKLICQKYDMYFAGQAIDIINNQIKL